MTEIDVDRDALRRRALGWAPKLTTTPSDPLGRDLVLRRGPDGIDLDRVDGIDALGQSLTVALTTMLGSDLFNVAFGFDGLRALAEETNPILARERVRIAVIQVLRGDPRVRRIGDVKLGSAALESEAGGGSIDEGLDTPDAIDRWRTVRVRVVFQTITGDEAAVDLGRVLHDA